MDQPTQIIALPTQIAIPRHFITSFQALSTVTEVNVICSTTIPAVGESGQLGLANTPEVQIAMTWVAAKELATLLASQVSQYEKDYGTLTSEYLKANGAG